MANAKKHSQLKALSDVMLQSSNFALIKHDKTTHIALENLRKSLKKHQSSVQVVKNSLIEKTIMKMADSNKTLKKFASEVFPLKETSALVSFNSDWSAGLSAFFGFSEKEQSLTFKAGILDNNIYKADELVKIAKLPSRPQLTAKLIGAMKSPMFSFVYGIKFNMQKLVYVLNEQAKKG